MNAGQALTEADWKAIAAELDADGVRNETRLPSTSIRSSGGAA